MQTPFYTLDELIILKQQGKLVKPVEDGKTGGVCSQPSQFRDVHQYDGQLYMPNLEYNKYSDSIKNFLLEKILILLDNTHSKQMAIKIMSDNTKDHANNVLPSDVFADILARRMTIDIFFLLEEQLSDNFNLGQCLQGRTNRLVQIRNMLV